MNDSQPFRAKEFNLVQLAQEYSDDDKARTLLESLRWPNGSMTPITIQTTPEMRRFNDAIYRADRMMPHLDGCTPQELVGCLAALRHYPEAREIVESARAIAYDLDGGEAWPPMPTIEPLPAPAPMPHEHYMEAKHTRYMEGVFTPLDSEEVQTACRKLWDELDKRNAALVDSVMQLKKCLAEKCNVTTLCAWERDAIQNAVIALRAAGEEMP